ncbi:MAG: triple tyrosine motif-containing protein, partial [Flavisolibacter sp.]
GVMNRIIDSRIVSVVQDTIQGRPVLITSPYGHFLAYYDLQQKKWISRLDSLNIVQRFNLRDNLVRKLYKDSHGNIWTAGIKTGLGQWIRNSWPRLEFFMHDPSNPESISGNNVYDIEEDHLGNLWIGIYGGGLNYFNVKTKTFTPVPSSQYLVEGITIDHHQHVWMISNGKVHKYDPGKKTHESFDLPDLEKTGGVKGHIFKDRQGKLYVAGSNYFISFHPDSIRTGTFATKVHLTDFQIFNKSYSHLLQQEKIRLHYRENYFAFEFAAPDYASGSTVQYAYMLEGFDKDWVEAGDRNYVSYPNLEGGDYTFKVRASTIPGTWPKNFASVKISIIPPFWKTAWFYLLCAILLLLAIYIVYRYRINELLKRQAIRNRIAQDLHDNVGSTLSSISVYSQVARIYHDQQKEKDLKSTLEKISSTSSEMISELNDTVWAINPRNDQMSVIFQRMESFAKPLLAAQQIRLQFSFDQQLESLNLEMETRKNFYLIFKEAVNNVIKYADCSQLNVHITQEGQKIHMVINDNGKGFDLSKTSEGFKSSDVYGGGNGLKNMQRRALEMKGILKMQSEPGNGTRLHLVFPIT